MAEGKKGAAEGHSFMAHFLWISILGVTGLVMALFTILSLCAGNLLSAGVMLLISIISSYAFYLEARSV